MENENLDETHPTEVDQGDLSLEDTQATPVEAPKKRRGISWFWWLLIAVLILVGVVAGSGYLGYQEGIGRRTDFETNQLAQAVKEQYDLGVQDIEAKRFEIARQRFEYVIQLDPDYPGVTDRLAEVMLAQNATATMTPVPPTPTTTPTIAFTPTPDLRGEAELFAQAEDYMVNQEWDEAIETLELLRKKNPEYNAIDVDGMLYLSLRNRGAYKIGSGDLELGIYDLSLAEGFGPLDTEANGLRTWARYYITGASFWEVDWGQAAYYFSQVYPMTPNMHDGTGWSAAQRYLEAVVHYSEYLVEQEDWCAAEEQLLIALELGADSSLNEVLDLASIKCASLKEDEGGD